MKAEYLVCEKYVFEMKDIWVENMDEDPTASQLTTMLWDNEKATNEYDLDEDTYYDIVFPYVKKLLK